MQLREEIFTIPGAPLEGVNPLPQFRPRKPERFKVSDRFPEALRTSLGTYNKVLPYLSQDRYSRRRDELKLKSYVLENEYLIARFLPQYGGRLWSLYDKVNERELLFRNPVIQPGNLAIRGAWLSGGIEWNIGNLGHAATTCDNVFCAILPDGEGNSFLRIYEFERLKSIFWQADFHLPDGVPHLCVHVRMVNPFEEATTTYWWSNTAVPEDGHTRILSSGKYVMSFTSAGCDYERLPHLDCMAGADCSYPTNASRSFDYFIQEDDLAASTWEAAAYGDGLCLYERSTAPLQYKKLFCWGNHRAGKRWQEFLSDGEGTGYYAEIQAGIAPSQLHDKMLPGHSSYEWTQCYGGMKLDAAQLHQTDFDAAADYFDACLSERLSYGDITALDTRLAKLADIPVTEEAIVHSGSGFGALEAIRMAKDGDGVVPASLCFPASSIGAAETPWLTLLETGIFPETDPRALPASYMISGKWQAHLEGSLSTPAGRNWTSLMHYGVMRYDWDDHTVYANASYDEERDGVQTAAARAAWEESARLTPNLWAYRNLAVLAKGEGNEHAAYQWYERASSLPGAFDDFALAAEYLSFLVEQKQHEAAWRFFVSLPENCMRADRIRITVAHAAVKLDKLDFLSQFFAESHYDIREGENSLTDIWFEFCARKLARERGISPEDETAMQALLDAVWDSCPPDIAIDFRMSLDRSLKYRV